MMVRDLKPLRVEDLGDLDVVLSGFNEAIGRINWLVNQVDVLGQELVDLRVKYASLKRKGGLK